MVLNITSGSGRAGFGEVRPLSPVALGSLTFLFSLPSPRASSLPSIGTT